MKFANLLDQHATHFDGICSEALSTMSKIGLLVERIVLGPAFISYWPENELSLCNAHHRFDNYQEGMIMVGRIAFRMSHISPGLDHRPWLAIESRVRKDGRINTTCISNRIISDENC